MIFGLLKFTFSTVQLFDKNLQKFTTLVIKSYKNLQKVVDNN